MGQDGQEMGLVIAAIAAVATPAVTLFLYINTRVNGVYAHIDHKNGALSAELEVLKREAVRHQDLKDVEARVTGAVNEVKADIRDLAKATRENNVEVVRAITELKTRLDIGDKDGR
jgi:hypothetical protein